MILEPTERSANNQKLPDVEGRLFHHLSDNATYHS